MLRFFFGPLRQPTAVLKAYPLCVIITLEKGDMKLIQIIIPLHFVVLHRSDQGSGAGLLHCPTDDTAIISKKSVLFINTRFECHCH
jgi:hypothetical protein